MSGKPVLVLFDLGGVMVTLADGMSGAAAAAGMALPRVGETVQAELVALSHAYERGELACEAYFAAAAAKSGLSAQEHRRLHEAFLVAPVPGMPELVEALAAGGVSVGCLSNTNAIHWAQMHEAGGRVGLPMHAMAHRFASHEIGATKPDAAIYAHVEAATGLEPASIVFFDDRAENVDAAAARGWRAHRVEVGNGSAERVRAVLAGYGLGS